VSSSSSSSRQQMRAHIKAYVYGQIAADPISFKYISIFKLKRPTAKLIFYLGKIESNPNFQFLEKCRIIGKHFF
jgi:hypothetical protein